MERFDSVNLQNVCINVWMKRVPRERHHIRATFQVDLVFPLLEVIAGVIHGHRVPLLEPITGDEHFITIILCEGWRFLVVLTVKDPSEEVILEVRNEVLEQVSWLPRGKCRATCLQSWIISVLAKGPLVEVQAVVFPH